MAFQIQDLLLTNIFTPLPNVTIKALPDGQPIMTSEDGGQFHPIEDPTRTVTTGADGSYTLPLPKPSQSYPSTIKWTVALPPSAAFPLGAAFYGQVPEQDGSFSLYQLATSFGWAWVQNTTNIPITVQGRPGIPGPVYSASGAGGFPVRPAANAVGASQAARVAIIEADDNQLQISDGTNWRDALGNVIA